MNIMPSWFSWDVVSAIGTVAAAVFAAYQIRRARIDANERAVLDHLRIIGDKALRAGATSTETAQQEVLAYYRGLRPDLTVGASAYLDLLNSLDVLAFAVKTGLVDKENTEEHIRTLVSPSLLTQSFLKDFQSCCGDDAVYEHLYEYFVALTSKRRAREEAANGE